MAFVGLKEGRPYEIFTGIADEEIFPIPKTIIKGKIIKVKTDDGKTRYDFQYTDKYGYKKTIEGLSHMFKPEFWNYAKLISGVLRHEMPIQDVVNLVQSLKLDSESINNWKNGVERALKKYIPNGTKAKGKCGECGFGKPCLRRRMPDLQGLRFIKMRMRSFQEIGALKQRPFIFRIFSGF